MHRMVHVMLEVCAAWSAIDVLMIALLAMTLQLEQLASFIVESVCAPVQFYLGFLGFTNINCFSVKASLISNFWLLLAVAVGVNVLLQVTFFSVNYSSHIEKSV